MVKPHGKNPEHAIILVEGFLDDGKKFVYQRYDFVRESADSLLQKGKGLVFIKIDPENFADFSELFYLGKSQVKSHF